MGIRKMDAKRLAKIMKALSNENRVALYMEIAKHEESDFEAPECTISDIVKLFGLSPPTISHHLKELANAELISTERRGKFLLARIVSETVDELERVVTLVRGR